MSDLVESPVPPALRLVNVLMGPGARSRRKPDAVFDRILARAQRGKQPMSEADLAAVEPLRGLLAEFAESPDMSPMGWWASQTMLGDRVRNRAVVAHLRATTPQIRDEQVTAPIYVVGLPRSGTTLTYSMLAQSPDHRGPRLWEMQNLGLAVDDATRDRLIAAARRRYAIVPLFSPRWQQIHPLDPAGEEEDTFVRIHSEFHASSVPAPRYRDLLRDTDLTDDYRYLREVLQVLSYGRPPARWVLKHPASLWRVPEIRRAFGGDVRFVWTHRSPEVSVASYCSLVEAAQVMAFRPGRIDLHAIGRTWLEILSDGAKRAASQRADLPDDAVVDIAYDDLVADPRATLRDVYGRLNMAWTAQDDAHLAAARERPGHTGHHYSLERYGLTAELVREAFDGVVP